MENEEIKEVKGIGKKKKVNQMEEEEEIMQIELGGTKENDGN